MNNKKRVAWNKGLPAWNRGKHSEKTKRIMREKKLGTKNYMYGKTHNQEIRTKIRDKRKSQIFTRYKTKPELEFLELIKKYNLPYKFTGDSSFWIQNINPDFVNCLLKIKINLNKRL